MWTDSFEEQIFSLVLDLCDKEKDEKDIPEADDDLNVHERMHIYRHRSFSSLLPLPSPRLLPPLLLLPLLSLLLCTGTTLSLIHI